MLRSTLSAAALAAGFLIVPPSGGAHGHDAGPLHIGHPWIRATAAGAPTAAGYLTVTNHGAVADRLIGGTSPLARSIEPHTMTMAGGVMRMRLAKDGFVIAPGATLNLAPGGGHLMLIAPTRAFKAGERAPVTLRFANAGDVKVDFVVETDAPAANAAMPGMAMH